MSVDDERVTLQASVRSHDAVYRVEVSRKGETMRYARRSILAKVAIICLVTAWAAGCDEPEEVSQEADQVVAQEESGEVEEDEAPAAEENDDADAYAYEDVLRGELRQLPEVPESLDELPEGLNIVQLEMRLLTAAMQNILQLIGDERLDEIPGQIRQVHPAYELTHQALEEGLYRPPVNPDQIEEFVEVDDEFHDDLRGLVGAARDDDLEGVTRYYNELVDGCTSCHGQFRFP